MNQGPSTPHPPRPVAPPPPPGFRPSAPPPGAWAPPPPGFGNPPGYEPKPAGWSLPAILSVVLLVVLAPVSVVLGIVALVRIRRTGQRGRGLAITGVVLGAILTVFGAVAVLVGAAGGVEIHAWAGHTLSGPRLASSITEQSGGRIQGLTCPDALPDTVGATVTCTGTVLGRPGRPVQVTTTGTQGDQILFAYRATP